jgi:hypothetical protein
MDLLALASHSLLESPLAFTAPLASCLLVRCSRHLNLVTSQALVRSFAGLNRSLLMKGEAAHYSEGLL